MTTARRDELVAALNEAGPMTVVARLVFGAGAWDLALSRAVAEAYDEGMAVDDIAMAAELQVEEIQSWLSTRAEMMMGSGRDVRDLAGGALAGPCSGPLPECRMS